MGFQLNTSVLNQKGSPAIYTDTFANRPPFGYAGRLFISNDTAAIYEDTGTAWVLIANVSSGAGTLQQVTTNGNTSNVGISVTAGGVSTNSATITSLTQGSVPFVGAAGLITQDNTNLFFDDTNNRLGINTNTPSNNLDVHGTGTSPLIAINNTGGNQSLIGFAKNSTAKWRIGNSATDTFDVLNVGLTTNAISINNSNNTVGLTGKLNGTTANLGNTNGTVGILNVTGRIALTTSLFFTSDLINEDRWEINGTLATALTFTKSPAAEYMRLTNFGNLLINSTTDDTVNKLQLTGSAKITGNVGIGGGTPSIFSTYSVASFGNLSTTNNGITIASTTSGSGLIEFADGTTGSQAYRGYIQYSHSSDSMFFATSGTTAITINSTGVTTIANLAGTGSRAVLADANGVLSAPVSDQTVKENIQPLQYGLNAIMQLNPISFEYIDEYKNYGEGLQIGNIAQDVASVIPEAVFTTPSTGLMGINYNQFNGIYIKAIQDLNARIELLLSRIEYLENK